MGNKGFWTGWVLTLVGLVMMFLGQAAFLDTLGAGAFDSWRSPSSLLWNIGVPLWNLGLILFIPGLLIALIKRRR